MTVDGAGQRDQRGAYSEDNSQYIKRKNHIVE
jgi:hypothetical protein